MPSPGPSDLRRAFSALWFPAFFAAAFSTMFLTSFASPVPHAMDIGVTGGAGQVRHVARTLDAAEPGGFAVRGVTDAATGRERVAHGQLAAVYVAGARPHLLMSSAASGTRADYLGAAVAGRLSAAPQDVQPAAVGDVSGTGVFFYGLPLALVGMITSIVLLQSGAWPVRRKAAVIAAAGAFASVFAYALATALDVLPGGHPLLLLYGFLLTQAIGWLTTAAALAAKKYFMPLSMTFVLVLGIPSSGGTVNADMLPGFARVLNGVLPFAQFVDLTRAEGWFDGQGTLRPLLTLLAWLAAGAALLAWAARRTAGRGVTRRTAGRGAAGEPVPAGSTPTQSAPAGSTPTTTTITA